MNRIVFDETFDKTGYFEKNISDIEVGEDVCITGRPSLKKGKTKNGEEFELFILKDDSGSVSQFLSDDDVSKFIRDKNIFGFDRVKVYCTVEKKDKNYTNIIMKNVEVEVVEDQRYIPTEEELKSKMKVFIKKITRPFYKDLIYDILKNEEVASKLFVSPATEKTAYNYKGGVAHSIIDAMELAEKIGAALNMTTIRSAVEIDTELLMLGAFLSNIGRVLTLTFDENGKIVKTLKGQMESDVIISRDLVGKSVERLLSKKKGDGTPFYDITEDKVQEILHIVSSCKGKVEYGALTIPRSKHAMYLADINSMIFTKGLFENLESEKGNEKFVRAYDNSRIYFIEKITGED